MEDIHQIHFSTTAKFIFELNENKDGGIVLIEDEEILIKGKLSIEELKELEESLIKINIYLKYFGEKNKNKIKEKKNEH